jgi:hypothetical protein
MVRFLLMQYILHTTIMNLVTQEFCTSILRDIQTKMYLPQTTSTDFYEVQTTQVNCSSISVCWCYWNFVGLYVFLPPLYWLYLSYMFKQCASSTTGMLINLYTALMQPKPSTHCQKSATLTHSQYTRHKWMLSSVPSATPMILHIEGIKLSSAIYKFL